MEPIKYLIPRRHIYEGLQHTSEDFFIALKYYPGGIGKTTGSDEEEEEEVLEEAPGGGWGCGVAPDGWDGNIAS